MDSQENNEIQMINSQDLVTTGLLKEGVFGYIYIGRFQNQNEEKIINKSFRGTINLEKLEYFYLDLCCISQMKDDHENVSKIIGYYDNPNMGIVMNYEGFYIRGKVINDLLTYLLHLRDEWERRRREFGDDAKRVPAIVHQEELHLFAIAIAKGCEYLHSKKITHGDLASRNILIDKNKTLKLSDYGMLNVKKYLVDNDFSTFSFRWLAPELIQKWKISAKGDVWSFGDVVWEIGTLGGMPYGDSDDTNILGLRFKYPYFKFYKEDNFTDEGARFLRHCFQLEPEKRPDFTNISNFLMNLGCKAGRNGECGLYKSLDTLPPNFKFPLTKHDLEEKTDMHIPPMNQTMFTEIKEIGYGTFGQVHLAQLLQPKQGHFKVAVKILYDNLEPIMALITEKLHEMKQHKNLVKIFGFSPQNEFIVMEYVMFSTDKDTELTGLEKYLKCLRRNLNNGSEIDYQELGWITVQIARGMAHLESLAVVHGNLAARNILINNAKMIKITDYFMPHAELKLTDKCRWASPELLNHGCYTIKSDVWAFGVVLWEIATFGGYPFGYMGTKELRNRMTETAIHPEIPSNIVCELQKLMNYCWKKNSIDRISFNEILFVLESWTSKKTIYLKYDFIPDLLMPPTKEECEKSRMMENGQSTQSANICNSSFLQKSSNSQKQFQERSLKNNSVTNLNVPATITTTPQPFPAVPTTSSQQFIPNQPFVLNRPPIFGNQPGFIPKSPPYDSQSYAFPPLTPMSPSPTRPPFQPKSISSPIYRNSYAQAAKSTGQTPKPIRFSPPN